MVNEKEDILDFNPPSQKLVSRAFAPMIKYFNPKVFGMEHLTKGEKYLFVGNHSIYGGADCPLGFAILYINTGIIPRGMGDHYHFLIPGWRELLVSVGAVRGTRENCATLMEAGECVVVYPGGGREVCKRKGEAYKLIWKDRTGFVRLAIEYGYKIVPLASVGADNSFSILFDANDFLDSRLGRQLTKVSAVKKFLREGEAVMPIARGLGPTLIPRPERYYFTFGKPIDTSDFAGRHDDKQTRLQLRKIVEDALYSQIQELLHYREQDTDKGLLRKLLTRL